MTGWPLEPAVEREFRGIQPSGQPLRFLLQRRGIDDRGAVTECYADIACDDVDVARSVHEGIGASLVSTFPWWTVMADPGGLAYCLTSRNPDTGRPPD